MTISLTLSQLQAMCVTEAGKQRAASFVGPLTTCIADDKWGVNTERRLCYFLAQVLHECGEFRYLSELVDGHAYDNRKDLGNTRPEAIALAKAAGQTAGAFFKGEGLIQITGYDNLLACSKALFGDDRVVHHPTMLREPDNAVRSAFWFWTSHKLNDLADKDMFTRVTEVINGGHNGIDSRRMYLKRCYAAMRAGSKS